MMLLAELVSASQTVAATPARNEKVALLAEAIRAMNPDELAVGVSYLAGVVPQGSFGIGYASVGSLPDAAHEASLTLLAVDMAFTEMAGVSGTGSAAKKEQAITEFFARATGDEQGFLSALLVGGLRQGASEKLMMDALAKAFAVPARLVRRAAMFSGDIAAVAIAAHDGGRDALAGFGLQLFRPVQPMLASAADGITAGLETLGEAAVECKLDGARIQVHRSGAQVGVYTRNLNDVTDRVPEIVAAVLDYRVESLVLDGEAIGLRPDGRPHPFQVTMGRFGSEGEDQELRLSPFFFDVLHVDGEDVIDLPASERMRVLDRVAPAAHRVPRIVTSDADIAEAFMADGLAAGHEGVVLKSLDAPYEAGRRGKGWLKVKPVHTLDLVVLAVEWGSGRRKGWLSNIHLGARDQAGGFVMLGKTFKGMTDKMLEWQTKRFLELETHREGHVVYVRPEQVVEIAFDGIQASSRYPGGMALRFARVKGYRDDKPAEEADSIDAVRVIFE